jgi:large subunit ribosomal protein L28
LTLASLSAKVTKLFQGSIAMAYACDITGKGKQFGNNVPFSQKKTRKVWKPNLQPMTIMVGGQKVRLKVATSTIRTLKKWERQEAARLSKADAQRQPAEPVTQPA